MSGSSDPVRVLLVEDDSDFAELISAFSHRSTGWTLIGHARTLDEAIRRISDSKPDVVLLDLNLPDSNGAETVDALLERFHPLAIVVLTAMDASGAADALRGGAQDYFDKADITPALLARTLRYAKERSSHLSTIVRQQELLEQFATHAAHDLTAPLRTMGVFAELLQEDAGDRLQPDEHKLLDQIVGGAQRLQTLISDLITHARTGEDEAVERLDLAAIVQDAVAELRPEIEDAEAELDVRGFPEAYGQPRAVRQAVRNLLSNAIKFRRANGSIVRVSGREEGGRCVLEVRDNGIGIPEDMLVRVTRPFVRLHPTGQYRGSGLGLTLVDRVVRRHGGTLRIQSVMAQGSVVSFDLPTRAEVMAAQ